MKFPADFLATFLRATFLLTAFFGAFFETFLAETFGETFFGEVFFEAFLDEAFLGLVFFLVVLPEAAGDFFFFFVMGREPVRNRLVVGLRFFQLEFSRSAMSTSTDNPVVGSELELDALKWVQNGYTLCRTSEGLPVFLHGALPGEKVRARIVKTRSGHCFARVEQVLTPAPERLSSDCSAFPACGGCSFRHLDYEAELELKLKLLGEFKTLTAALEAAEPRVYSAEPGAYRRAVQIHADPEAGGAGFFALHTNDIVPLPKEGCAQLTPALNQAVRDFSFQEPGRFSFQDMGESVLTPAGPTPGGLVRAGLDSFHWDYPASGFFQNNLHLTSDWLEFLRAAIPDGKPSTLELFCGSGVIGGFCRELLGDYRGLDSHRPGIKAARKNFKSRGFQGDFQVEDLYRSSPDFSGFQLLISNPPRAGMKQKLLREVIRVGTPTILYSSCNPATLDRDLGILAKEGYGTVKTAVFDFFPRTPHLEVVVLLERKAK